MTYRTMKVFEMRAYAPQEVWSSLWTTIPWTPFYDWFVDLDPDHPVSKWLIEQGAGEHELVLLDLR